MDLRPRDCLVVVSLFCIGFGKQRLSHVLKCARDSGADFWAVEQQMDTRRSALLFPAMLQSLELLRSFKSTATKEGLEEARSKGRVGGRRPVLSDEKISRARELIAAGHHTMAEIAKLLGVSRSSLYNGGLSVRRAV
jgi:DNA invertase Pin-like site-specific DNA recombinase